jgi:hypothetical protein
VGGIKTVSPPLRLLVEWLVFGAAAAGLAVADQPRLALVMALLVAFNLILLWVWQQ